MSEGTATTPGIVQMLMAMERWGTSDLFVCEGKVPAVRLHGVVVKLELAPTPRGVLEDFLAQEVRDDARQRYLESGDLDMGFSPAAGKRSSPWISSFTASKAERSSMEARPGSGAISSAIRRALP